MIYLDHAAATPVSPKALAAMQPYFSTDFYNPSAPYLPAKHVREAYEAAKDTIAHTIGAKGVDLVMTAGATESINLAFTACQSRALVLTTEHTAVLAAAKACPDYQLIPVDKNGLIQLDTFRKMLDDSVDFVSISLANNELGTIQPLAEVAEILRTTRQSRLKRGIMRPLLFHSDASQALSLIDISVARLGVDLLTLNAAKCGGPKGIGALYVGHQVRLQPITVGGGQERGLRSGTENVPATIGFAIAAEEAKKHLSSHRKLYQEMANIIRKELSQISSKTPAPNQDSAPHTSIVAHNSEKVKHNLDKNPKDHNQSAEIIIPEPIFLGHPKHQLVSFVPVCFPGLDAERLIYKLEAEEILVSTGAACAANKGTKSHVLEAIGLSDREIAGSLRISLGSTNNLDQITEAATIIIRIVCDEYYRLSVRGSGATANLVGARANEMLASRLEATPQNLSEAKRRSGSTLQRQESRTRLEQGDGNTPFVERSNND